MTHPCQRKVENERKDSKGEVERERIMGVSEEGKNKAIGRD